MNFFPFFNKGQILKQNMLEALRDTPRSFLKVFFQGYGDGILSGFITEIDNDNKKIKISEGVLVKNGELYFNDSPTEIDIQETTSEIIVYADIEKSKINEDGEEYKIIFNDTQGIELFRYKKTVIDAKLKLIENNFEKEKNNLNCDFFKRGDRISLLDSKQSVLGGKTIRNEVLTLFAKKMLSIVPCKPEDFAFIYQCLNGISSKIIVDTYFEIESGNCTKDELLNAMNKKLQDAHNYYPLQQQANNFAENDEQIAKVNNGIGVHYR